MEMDTTLMMLSPLVLTASFLVGVLAGVAYFLSLWRSAQRIASGEKARVTVAWMLGRLIVTGFLLTFVAIEGGALALLLLALGIFIGRALVLRRLRAVAQ